MYLSVNVIDVGQALRKQVAHPFAAFRGGVIKAFSFGDSLFSGDIEKDVHALGGACNFNLLGGRGAIAADNTLTQGRSILEDTTRYRII